MPFPFALPERFLDQIGYTGRFSLVEMYWEGAGDELAVYDPDMLVVGMHNPWPYLELMHRGQVWHWLGEHYIDLGSSDGPPATHHLIVWKERNQGHLATARRARRIVGRQRFAPEDFF